MEIKINIPENDYVQPTEVREDVVQMICDFIIGQMKKGVWIEDAYDIILKHNDGSYSLYLFLRKDDSVYGVGNGKSSVGDLNCIRIRTAEMKAVFDVFQDAGYHIFRWSYTTGEKKYVFTKKPVYDNREATRIEFTEFID